MASPSAGPPLKTILRSNSRANQGGENRSAELIKSGCRDAQQAFEIGIFSQINHQGGLSSLVGLKWGQGPFESDAVAIGLDVSNGHRLAAMILKVQRALDPAGRIHFAEVDLRRRISVNT